jgi:hypothetical protein
MVTVSARGAGGRRERSALRRSEAPGSTRHWSRRVRRALPSCGELPRVEAVRTIAHVRRGLRGRLPVRVVAAAMAIAVGRRGMRTRGRLADRPRARGGARGSGVLVARRPRRRRCSRAAAALSLRAAVIAAVVVRRCLFGPLLLSRDTFLWAEARCTVHHANPYRVTPSQYPQTRDARRHRPRARRPSRTGLPGPGWERFLSAGGGTSQDTAQLLYALAGLRSSSLGDRISDAQRGLLRSLAGRP